MIKYILTFLSLYTSIAWSCINNANESCISIMMTDLYGDGWDGARLYAEFPDGATGKNIFLLK